MAAYKIKDLETLTGIKAHTIRIWEKRYGLISPERSETQIRTYNDQELSMLLNIALLNNNGVKISKIAQMESQEISDLVWKLKSSDSVDSSTEKLILSLIDLDEELFKKTVQNLMDTLGLEKTFTEKLIPFLDRIGVMWMVGTINPAQEHFISNLLRQKIISEIDKLPSPNFKETPVLLFLPEHEWHEISLLIYQYSLRSQGINTIYLGQSLPYESLLECINKLKPKALITSWLTSVDEAFIVGYFSKLSSDYLSFPIYAGGSQINKNRSLLNSQIVEITDLSVLKLKSN